MFGKNFGRLTPGARQVPAAAVNRPNDATEALSRLRAGPGMAQSMLRGIPLVGALIPIAKVAKAGGGILGRSGTTPGAADVTLYNFDGATLTAGATVRAYNLATGAVAGSAWLILLNVGRYWFVIWEEC